MVAARGEHEARVVLHVLAANFPRAVHRQLYRVAQLPDREFPAFANLPDDIDGRVVLLFFRNEGYLRARHNQRNCQVIVGIVLAEERRSRIKRHIHARQLRGQLVLELLLAVRAVQVLEIPSRVVARPKIELQVGPVDLYFQSPESSILQRVVAGES